MQTNDESNEEEEGFNLEIKLIDRTQTLNAYQIKSGGNSLEDNDEMNDDKLLQRQIKRPRNGERQRCRKVKNFRTASPYFCASKAYPQKKKDCYNQKLVNAFDENESE